MVLEELEHAKARGAKIYAEVVGYGATGDAYHITSPIEDGSGAARAMTDAMNEAGAKPEEIPTSTHMERVPTTTTFLRQSLSSPLSERLQKTLLSIPPSP